MKIGGFNKKVLSLATMMIDSTLIDYELSVNELPSKVAGAALYLALNLEAGLKKENAWTTRPAAWDVVKAFVRYPEESLRPIAKSMYNSFKAIQGGKSKEQAIMKKYKDASHFFVGTEVKFE